MFCFVCNKLSAQTYTFNPSKIYVTYLDTSESNFGGIEVNNTGSVNLDFIWRRDFVDTLIDSRFELCNSGICFLHLPFSGFMPTILPGNTGWIKFHLYSGKATGLNTLKYILYNGPTQTDTLTFKIYVVAGITSNKEIGNVSDKMALFPNPTINQTNLSLELKKESNVKIEIFNHVGQIVSSEKFDKLSYGQHNIPINTTEFASGVYSVTILTNKG